MPSLSSFDHIEKQDTATFEIPEVPDPAGVPYLELRLCDRSNMRLYKQYIKIIKKLSKGRRNLERGEALEMEEEAFLELLPRYGVAEWGTINGKRNPEPVREAEIREWLTQLREVRPDVFRRMIDFAQTVSNFREEMLSDEETAELGEGSAS